ncbi:MULTISPECIES: ArsR/SmtB family transcription factor [Croceitalea]|uniref:Helix-turn-helix transcriptional regulator n=2 Tax=Croceitalea TaxID=574891 RepID=A0ABU3A987_9FLAO|nr:MULTISPECIES: helix-turn-helix transcriptional regulator [unclassified Croceitalea]MDT0538478.1 helix-turn-helix transcriptional regulator [Croceitalea sp. P059]MDT0606524.1 helix-turn-helix transcriptional regulator [Croceitalea sp. F388]MDT0620256.1 helix-turn-helix transcriptional regulator [Croceitalea sp. P007]
MNIVEISKILSNQTRVDILKWLKDPEANFPPHQDIDHFDDGVCVGFIQDKTGLSQSTISTYLNSMQNARLVIPTRHGKWTYYKRNDDVIQAYMKSLKEEL